VNVNEMFDPEEIEKLAAGEDIVTEDDADDEKPVKGSKVAGGRSGGKASAKSDDAPSDEADTPSDDEPDPDEPAEDDEEEKTEEGEEPADETPEIQGVDTVSTEDFQKLETEYLEATETIYNEESAKHAPQLQQLASYEEQASVFIEKLRNKTVEEEDPDTGEVVKKPAGLTADEQIKLTKVTNFLDKVKAEKQNIIDTVKDTAATRIAQKWIETSCKAHPKLADYKAELGTLLEKGQLTDDPIKNLALAKVERAQKTGRVPSEQKPSADAKKEAAAEQLRKKQAGAITAGKGSGGAPAKSGDAVEAGGKGRGGDKLNKASNVERYQVGMLAKALNREL
jgi:hypothetical protein